MKVLAVAIAAIFSLNAHGLTNCSLEGTFNKSKHYECDFKKQGKSIHFFVLLGDIADSEHAHFLAHQVRKIFYLSR